MINITFEQQLINHTFYYVCDEIVLADIPCSQYRYTFFVTQKQMEEYLNNRPELTMRILKKKGTAKFGKGGMLRTND